MKGNPPTWFQTMKQKKTTRLSANKAQQAIEASWGKLRQATRFCSLVAGASAHAVGDALLSEPVRRYLRVRCIKWRGKECKVMISHVTMQARKRLLIHMRSANVCRKPEKPLPLVSELQNFRWLESWCPLLRWIENSLHHSASRHVGRTQHTRLKHVWERTHTEAELPTSSSDTALSPGPTIALSCGQESRPKVAKKGRMCVFNIILYIYIYMIIYDYIWLYIYTYIYIYVLYILLYFSRLYTFDH
jgi:hypothetical protein